MLYKVVSTLKKNLSRQRTIERGIDNFAISGDISLYYMLLFVKFNSAAMSLLLSG